MTLQEIDNGAERGERKEREGGREDRDSLREQVNRA